jgi:hypothetical protein
MRRGLVHGGFRPGMPGWVHVINYFPNLSTGLLQLLTRRNWRKYFNPSGTNCYPPFVSTGTSQRNRMLPLRFQGLAHPNPNIDALSKKIHLLQSHWDTGSMVGRMLLQAYQVFQVEVRLGGNIFSQSFISFGRLATHGFIRNLWELLHR